MGFGDKYLLHKAAINVLLGLVCAATEAAPDAGIDEGRLVRAVMNEIKKKYLEVKAKVEVEIFGLNVMN